MTSTDRKFIVHVSLEIVILGTMGYFFYNKSKMLEERLKKLEDLMNETQGSLKVLLNNKPEPENQLEKQLQRLELEKKVQKAQQDLFQQQLAAQQQREKQQLLAHQQLLEQKQRLEQQQLLAQQQRLEQQQRIEEQRQKVVGISQVNNLNKLEQEEELIPENNSLDISQEQNENNQNICEEQTNIIDIDLTQFNNSMATKIEVIEDEDVEDLDKEIENELNELNTDIL